MSSDETNPRRRRRVLTNLVNHFSIKRQAHSLSRQSNDQTWNLFRHVWRPERASEKRAETWDAPSLEAGGRGRINSGVALTTFASAPPVPAGYTSIPNQSAAVTPGITTTTTTAATGTTNFNPNININTDTNTNPHTDSGLLTFTSTSPVAGSTAAATAAAADSLPISATSGKSLQPLPTPVDSDRPFTTQSAADSDTFLRKRRPDEDVSFSGGHKDRDQDHDGASSSNSNSNNNNGGGGGGGGKKEEKPAKTGLIRHLQPKEPFTVANQIQRTLLSSWINLLIVAAPVGIALNYIPQVSRVAVFVVNFIAIIPLAAMLGFATEEIALRTGETLGGLLNATFGNAVELIVAIIALADGKVAIVQTSLIGSILSNLLLVMGCCFFFGGLRRREQHFNTVVAQTAASMLALATASVIVPTVFDNAANTPVGKVAKLSRGTAIILLVVYAAYLFFQLKTHQEVFSEESQKVPAKPWSTGSSSFSTTAARTTMTLRQGLAQPGIMMGRPLISAEDDAARFMNPQGVAHAAANHNDHDHDHDDADADDDDGEEDPQLHFWVAIATLALSTVIIALCAEFMVDSIDAITQNGGLSEEFVGLILLPIVGNAAEHATAVTVAIKDKMDLAIGVAVGSSMQVALFLIPLLVVIGWGMGNEEMNLSFDTFQVAVMFVAVLLVNYLIGDGKSHWLEGWLLICLYAIIAVCAIWYPNQDTITVS